MKKWYLSKTLRLSFLAFVGALISGITGENWLDGEMQIMISAVIAAILRKFTDESIGR